MSENMQMRPPRRGPGGPGPRMRIAEKPKDFKKSWGKIIRFARPWIAPIAVAVVASLLGTALSLVMPKALSRMTNLIGSSISGGAIDLGRVGRIGIAVAAMCVAGALLTYAQSFIMATVTQKLSYALRARISGKINRLPLRYFDSTTYGDVLSRVTNDVDSVGFSLNRTVVQLVSAITLFFGSIVMMFVTDWAMALVAIASSVLGFGFMTLIVSRSQKYFVRQQRRLGQLNGHVEEIYSGHTVVRAYNGEKKAQETFDAINGALRESSWKAQFMSGLMQPLMGFVGNLGYVAVCVAGALFLVSGRFSLAEIGILVEFMIYVRLFTQPLSQIGQATSGLQSIAAAGERVFEFLEEEELPDESGKTARLEGAKGDVVFDRVRFGYTPDRTIIRDFSAHALPGQKIAIVGPTGAGKTTMVNLLMRFYETDGGEIRVDGVPVRDLTRENVHDLFGMVLQDTWLFEGTIRENVAYSKKGVTDGEIEAACRAVGLHRFIKTLPDGYDTVIGERTGLSQGQRQLVTIARAMVENAPLLILDEATSSVDTRTETLIQEAMDRLTKGRTSFIIAHRLSTIRNADLILVMKDGDVVESGTHAELLEKGGFYAELYNSQFDPASA